MHGVPSSRLRLIAPVLTFSICKVTIWQIVLQYMKLTQGTLGFAGAPGKLSYGSYMGLVSIINFGVWIMAIVVALLIAGQLVWLTMAFVLNSALTYGVT